jgi:hypothetical protein
MRKDLGARQTQQMRHRRALLLWQEKTDMRIEPGFGLFQHVAGHALDRTSGKGSPLIEFEQTGHIALQGKVLR